MAQSAEEKKALDRIAAISTNIREAIRAALPTGPEQYLHIMVPGKVINFDVGLLVVSPPSSFTDI